MKRQWLSLWATFILSFLFVGSLGVASAEAVKPTTESTAAPVAPRKNQLEELFIWKLSDELRLTPAKEAAFANLIREINQKKYIAGQKIEEATKTFIQTKDKAAKEINFKALRKAYVQYNEISLYELNEMKKLIGLDSVATYLQVKQDLTSKVKSLLIQNDKKDSESADDAKSKNAPTILPPPKVIEVTH